MSFHRYSLATYNQLHDNYTLLNCIFNLVFLLSGRKLINISLSHSLYCPRLSLIKAWSDRVELGRAYAVYVYARSKIRCVVWPLRIPWVYGRTKCLNWGMIVWISCSYFILIQEMNYTVRLFSNKRPLTTNLFEISLCRYFSFLNILRPLIILLVFQSTFKQWMNQTSVH